MLGMSHGNPGIWAKLYGFESNFIIQFAPLCYTSRVMMLLLYDVITLGTLHSVTSPHLPLAQRAHLATLGAAHDTTP